MVQGLQWIVLLGVQVSIILAFNGFQIYTVQVLQWTVLLRDQVYVPNTIKLEIVIYILDFWPGVKKCPYSVSPSFQSKPADLKAEISTENHDGHLHAEEGEDQVQLNTECQGCQLDAKEGEDKVGLN